MGNPYGEHRKPYCTVVNPQKANQQKLIELEDDGHYLAGVECFLPCCANGSTIRAAYAREAVNA